MNDYTICQASIDGLYVTLSAQQPVSHISVLCEVVVLVCFVFVLSPWLYCVLQVCVSVWVCVVWELLMHRAVLSVVTS